MGIDKPDINFVVHFTFSSCLEEYIQGIGRAERDSQPSQPAFLVKTCVICASRVTETWADSMTELATLVIHCLMELLPHCQTVHVSVHLLCKVLVGSVSADIITNNLDKLNSYGKVKTFLDGRSNMKSLNKFIYKLIMKGYMREELSNMNNKRINLNLVNITELLSGSISV